MPEVKHLCFYLFSAHTNSFIRLFCLFFFFYFYLDDFLG
jgi:hypothetical protein